ncbi:MAG: pantetheine-phosphate adenylyltransferase, partial [Lachnospiraceae bacterium]|nr:pantetheine-phosphate adenylyltransferase [Lachnospiraceae bacterium]
MKTGIYAGSFDPITLGHLDIIKRASRITNRLIIAVLNNNAKKPAFSVEERLELIRKVTKDIPNVEVMSFSGLTVDFAKQQKANVLIRGLRAVTDFEYELQIAQGNHKLNPDLDTVFLTTSVEVSVLIIIIRSLGFNNNAVRRIERQTPVKRTRDVRIE